MHPPGMRIASSAAVRSLSTGAGVPRRAVGQSGSQPERTTAMDAGRFDTLARSLTNAPSRRAVLSVGLGDWLPRCSDTTRPRPGKEGGAEERGAGTRVRRAGSRDTRYAATVFHSTAAVAKTGSAASCQGLFTLRGGVLNARPTPSRVFLLMVADVTALRNGAATRGCQPGIEAI